MNYYQDYVRDHHHEPSYHELKEMVRQAEDEIRDEEELVREQVREMRIALGDEKEKPDPKPAKTCDHLRENGQYCLSIAVGGRDFCPYHLRERGRLLKMARARARHQRWRLQLPPLEDLYAVQVGIGQVLNALLSGQLDRSLGGVVLYGLQQASTNLCRPREVWEGSSHFQSSEQLELPGFEAEYGLPHGLDLDTPPEVAFPETETSGAALSEERAGLMEVTSLDVELMELRQREGLEAVARRLKQVEQAEERRHKKAQAQLAHARYVALAAAQNAAREAQFAVRSEADQTAVEAEEKTAAANPAPSSGAAGAPPSSASVAGRAGKGLATRKKPQPSTVAAKSPSGSKGRVS